MKKLAGIFSIYIFALAAIFASFSQANFAFATSSEIYINEIFPGKTAVTKWVEIYNSSNGEIDISNWRIYPVTAETGVDFKTPLSIAKLGQTIEPHGFFAFEIPAGKGLSENPKGKGVVIFSNAQKHGEQIGDVVYYPVMTIGTSYARSVDGGEIWMICENPTKNLTNISQQKNGEKSDEVDNEASPATNDTENSADPESSDSDASAGVGDDAKNSENAFAKNGGMSISQQNYAQTSPVIFAKTDANIPGVPSTGFR